MKKINLLLILSISFLFTGCFEILEDVSFNADGSGKFKLEINMSQSKSQISKIMSQDSINGRPIPSKEVIVQKLAKTVSQLKQQQGISNVNYSSNFDDYIFKFSFQFSNTKALDSAVANIIRINDPKAMTDPVSYKWSDKQLTRSLNSVLVSQIKKDKEKVAKFLGGFENAKLTSIFRFENEISTVANQQGKTSSNKKNYFLQAGIDDILNKKSLQTIQIETK